MQILLWQSLKDDGKTAFVLGGSWELPVKMGLLESNFVDELKEDGTYNDQTFEREYGSIWSGTFEGSFFDADQFDKLRKLKTAIFSSEIENNIKYGAYYVVSVDVGRLNDRSVVCVFKVFPNPSGSSEKSLVYMDQFEQEHFEIQSYKIKEIINNYNAKVLVIDANGLGAGLIDYLVRPTKDFDGKEVYPPYAVLNDERYDKYKTDDSIPMIYNIKANSELNNIMAVNTLTQMSSNKIKFLIDEKAAKVNLMKQEEENKKRLTSVQRARKLKPYILTSQLKEEMLNLRRKKTNEINSLVVLEQVNRKLHKDKYSAFSYGLYWIKLQDDSRKKYKQSNKFKSVVMYTTNKRWK